MVRKLLHVERLLAGGAACRRDVDADVLERGSFGDLRELERLREFIAVEVWVVADVPKDVQLRVDGAVGCEELVEERLVCLEPLLVKLFTEQFVR